ncbi:MAG: hypothetical protein HWE30_02260 [Methylocystaceae bacterium]|nr:hypothetical protein [Methylocystaceae bacterium]
MLITDVAPTLYEATANDDWHGSGNGLYRIPVRVTGYLVGRLKPFHGNRISARLETIGVDIDNIRRVIINDEIEGGQTIQFDGDVGVFARDIISALEAVTMPDYLVAIGDSCESQIDRFSIGLNLGEQITLAIL